MRKVIQISTAAVVGDDHSHGPNLITTALCDDGTIWERGWPINNRDGEWSQLPPIPQNTPAAQESDQ